MIVLGQGPDAMHVVRQQDPGVHRERACFAHGMDGVTQGGPQRVVAEDGTAAVSDDREEIGGTGEEAAVAGHGAAS